MLFREPLPNMPLIAATSANSEPCLPEFWELNRTLHTCKHVSVDGRLGFREGCALHEHTLICLRRCHYAQDRTSSHDADLSQSLLAARFASSSGDIADGYDIRVFKCMGSIKQAGTPKHSGASHVHGHPPGVLVEVDGLPRAGSLVKLTSQLLSTGGDVRSVASQPARVACRIRSCR